MVVGRMKLGPTRLYQKEQELPPFWQGMPNWGTFHLAQPFMIQRKRLTTDQAAAGRMTERITKRRGGCRARPPFNNLEPITNYFRACGYMAS
jgi:hypothetical protein